jgi:hypothetical protein
MVRSAPVIPMELGAGPEPLHIFTGQVQPARLSVLQVGPWKG